MLDEQRLQNITRAAYNRPQSRLTRKTSRNHRIPALRDWSSGRGPEQSPSFDERRLFKMFSNNQVTTKAKACHGLNTSETSSLLTVKQSLLHIGLRVGKDLQG
ncbi:hypothetical protein AMECASPLE_019814 [Ameca splendens]|uniref:Uncharacterized protein n=1 Tax=Ameca splendens TaxID=208324 RepID=A0ABV1AAN1_9TELE